LAGLHKFVLCLLEFVQVFLLFFGHELVKFLNSVALWSKLESLQLGVTVFLLEFGRVVAILLEEDIGGTRFFGHFLLFLFIVVQDAKAHIVPQLGVSFEQIGRLFEVLKCLLVLLIFVEGQTHVENDLAGSLRIQVTDELVGSVGRICCVLVVPGLVGAVSPDLLRLVVGRVNRDVLRYLEEFQALRESEGSHPVFAKLEVQYS